MPPPRFASDLDEDLELPIVTTFYSLRGGVGRSTALAYTASILAARGRKVVCVDMDLEAPGLTALFGLETEIGLHQGVVELLFQLDQREQPDFASHLLQVAGFDNLYLIPAGLPDADYARRLRFVNPSAWYREERNPLQLLFRGLRQELPFTPDVILLDARTGITELSGPLLFDIADVAVVTFFPHPPAQHGTELLVRGLLAAQTHRYQGDQALTPELRFLVSPVPASSVSEVVKRYQHWALSWIAEWVEPANQARTDAEPLIESEITQFVQYREEIATTDQVAEDSQIWRLFEPVAEWLERFLPIKGEERAKRTLKRTKPDILGELVFASGTAEHQQDFLRHFVETQVVREALNVKVPLVLGRKGTGKTAVFRRLSEVPDHPAIVVHAPSDLRSSKGWLLSSDGFAEAERILERLDAEWRHFWSLYCTIAVAHQLDGEIGMSIPSDLDGLPSSESELLDGLERILQGQRAGINLNDWLNALDRGAPAETLLVLDGLDTGFGSSNAERRRRREAIEGLFVFWMERGVGLQHLHFKIVLREDIWRELHFQNKSHLFGRSVTLKWKDPANYFKVVLKQALSSANFQEILQDRFGRQRFAEWPVDEWSDEDLFAAWNVLVGERMKGGKTAFTRNWVWNRLADANNDHTPRYVLQLFHEAVPWEKAEHLRSPYDRSVLRPRALTKCLPTVSEQALTALKEEFAEELGALLEGLRAIGRTPISAVELKDHEAAVELAREVGLLVIYEEGALGVERYNCSVRTRNPTGKSSVRHLP